MLFITTSFIQEALPEDGKENDDANIDDDLDLESFGEKKKKKKKKKPKDLDDLIGAEEDKENEGKTLSLEVFLGVLDLKVLALAVTKNLCTKTIIFFEIEKVLLIYTFLFYVFF